jgi:hypothetical protein
MAELATVDDVVRRFKELVSGALGGNVSVNSSWLEYAADLLEQQKAKIEQLHHDLHEARSENSELRAQHHRMADRLYRLSDPVQDERNDDEPHGPPPNQGSGGKHFGIHPAWLKGPPKVDPEWYRLKEGELSHVAKALARIEERLDGLERREPW